MLNLLTFYYGFRGHEFMLYKPLAHLDIIKNFLQSVIDEWNLLPETVLHYSTLPTFNKLLDCYLKNWGYN